jgi:membrane-bound metal-dependent hydrolase YbcI (DUF457 family)
MLVESAARTVDPARGALIPARPNGSLTGATFELDGQRFTALGSVAHAFTPDRLYVSSCLSSLENATVFVGHYGVSYAGKAADWKVPLWVLFLSVQFLDVLWGVFVLLGLERVRITPGITATNPLDLYYMPYTHSLVGAVVWSVVAAFLYWAWRGRRENGRGHLVVGAAVLSHWWLDLLVHRPDLPLIGDRFKVGIGLWNLPAVAFALEAIVLIAGLLLYLRSTERISRGGTIGSFAFVVLLLAVQAMTFFGAPPSSASGAAITALVAYFLLAGMAGWLETKRRPLAVAVRS